MKRLLFSVTLAGALVLISVSTAGAPAAAPPPPSILAVSLTGHFINPAGITLGAFFAEGAVSDSGSYRDLSTRLTPLHPTKAPPTAIDVVTRLRGSKGTLTIKIHATLKPLAPLAVDTGGGTSAIISGTGAYAALHGVASPISFVASNPHVKLPGLPTPTHNFLILIAVFHLR